MSDDKTPTIEAKAVASEVSEGASSSSSDAEQEKNADVFASCPSKDADKGPIDLEHIAPRVEAAESFETTDSSEKGLLRLPPRLRTPSGRKRRAKFQMDQFHQCIVDLDAVENRMTREFYRSQNELIGDLEDIGEDEGCIRSRGVDHRSNEDVGEGADSSYVTPSSTIPVRISFVCNVLLFLAKLVAAIVSGSIIVIASVIDSGLDILSGLILYITTRAQIRWNVYKYPAGKARMEPVGVIIFATIMATASLNLIQEVLRDLLDGKPDNDPDLDLFVVIILGTTVAVKLILFLHCRNYKHNAAVAAYAQDHINDTLTNGFAICAYFMSIYVAWWVDPATAGIFALYIVSVWMKNAYMHLRNIVGISATPRQIRKLIAMVYNFDSRILQLDTIRAYHMGEKLYVEIDIVLPGEMSLREAHDIGQLLQDQLEDLEDIERAFVHLDYETSHKVFVYVGNLGHTARASEELKHLLQQNCCYG